MQIVNATDPTPLPVGVYNAINAVYPGFSFTSTLTNETTIWQGSSSRATGLADFSFRVVPVRSPSLSVLSQVFCKEHEDITLHLALTVLLVCTEQAVLQIQPMALKRRQWGNVRCPPRTYSLQPDYVCWRGLLNQ